MEHDTCIPYLAKSKGTKNSQTDAELRKFGYVDVNIPSRTKDRKKLEVDLKEKLIEEVKGIEEIRKPLLIGSQRKECEIKESKERF